MTPIEGDGAMPVSQSGAADICYPWAGETKAKRKYVLTWFDFLIAHARVQARFDRMMAAEARTQPTDLT